MHYIQAMPTALTVLSFVYMNFLVARSNDNGRSKASKLFLLFVIVDSLWLVAVFTIDFSPLGSNLLVGRLAFAASVALVMLVQAFINALLGFRYNKLYSLFLYGYGVVLCALTLGTDLIVKGIHTSGYVTNLAPLPVYGMLYPLFLIYVIVAMSVYFLVLLKRAAILRRNDITKQLLNLVALGLAFFAVLSLLTNLILPAILKDPWPSQFAPLGSLALVFSFFYAIGRYRLFDIKTAVLRSTTYLFLLGGLALLFAISVNLVGSLIANDSHGGPNVVLVFNTIIALIMAVSFYPLKGRFDRLTNRYFFRGAYDAHSVISELNAVLIRNADLSKMLVLCEQVVTSRVGIEYCSFKVFSTERSKSIDISPTSMSEKERMHIENALRTSNNKMIEARPPSTVQVDTALRSLLKHKNISALVQMNAPKERIGYMIVGEKKNGDQLSSQDIGLLSTVADQVALAAQNALRFEEIEQFNLTLQQKVDDATRKLRETNRRLKLLDETKDDFISMASHQLRTPLTSVKGYLSLVLDGDAGPVKPGQRKLLGQAFTSSQRMVYLIADLLNVSRLRTGKFVIETAPTNLADVVQDEVDQLIETAQGRQLELTYHKPAHFPLLELDETKIRQVIMNFIDNAIYYTPAGGRIEVSLRETDKSVELRVTDNGIGVPRAEQHHLFTKFYRARNAQKARPDGTGLGLFMAQKVVVAQDGAIIFTSREGKGSTFGFIFPKAKHLAPPITPELTPKHKQIDVR